MAIALLAGDALAQACHPTPEYEAAQLEAHQEVHGPLRQCYTSVANWHFWKAYSECKAAGAGKNVGGGCAHIAGYRGATTPRDRAHCEILKPTEAEFQEYLAYLVKERGINQCK